MRSLRDVKTKLMSKVMITNAGCWQWTGSRFKKKYGDYGQIRIGRRNDSKLRRAHVVSYETFVAPIPNGLELDHLCHNTLCINPEHLELVTHPINMKRRKDSGLLQCKYGHVYTKETTFYNVKGKRECRICRKIRAQKWYEKKRSNKG